ncbi:type-F conjugative transfer system secretin TraK (plasmid) [Azospirillum oryzae]|uniref:Type-F conjugative transfer system secretin TraK n=1 Tax=Azospirillum oryzae TaxID=286727 RepID=A0A6N1ATF7_9PROT|nr:MULTISPECIES: type-F conjugative transfer system secretin TraK [Azospirillum]KAA0584786.1 hypothetical protein FZ938_28760 [Azospirillum oryzae]QCG99183.1 hypothetical protein E6C67_35945 [Azospirillum sp. TSA2s]QKS54639.1 type-F conjugative transfer system secretin TraK [Azospirillum oryzae]GLR77525.1 hypothetical protein GCM10007856_01930 [Azospirillum oryzae]
MKRVQPIILASVSAFAVLVGQQIAQAQTPELPVAPLSEIEAAYNSSKAAAPASDLDTLQKAIQEEIDARGGKPNVALPSQSPKGTVPATPVATTPPRSATPTAPAATQAVVRNGTAAAPKIESTVELPAVPSSVVAPGPAPASEDLAAMTQPAVITIRPGTTELLAVAEGHANRIVTPFAEPAVMTTSDAKFKISGNVVYVSTTSPATIFITPKGDESVAIPLALVPRRVPPREIQLQLPRGGVWNASFTAGGAGAAVAGNKKAQTWEESQPYIETIRSIMRDIALGTVPSGYQMRDMERGDRAVECTGPAGVTFQFGGGQVMEGSHLQVVIGVVSNQSGASVELAEPWCAGPNVAAVAYWPNNVLAAGQSTEVFVIRRPALPSETDARRPSLLTRAGAVR